MSEKFSVFVHIWLFFATIRSIFSLSEDYYYYYFADFLCIIISDLQVPVLVRHPNNQSLLLVNFDPYIFEVIKEAEYMMKLDLEIPDAAKCLVHSKDKLKDHKTQMQVKLSF